MRKCRPRFFRHLQVIVPESQQAQRQGDDQAGNDKGIAHSGAQQGSRRHGPYDQHAAHGGRSRLGPVEFRQLVHLFCRPDGLADFREISARMTRGANIMVRAKETRQARRALPAGSANAPEGLNCSITECIKFTVAER